MRQLRAGVQQVRSSSHQGLNSKRHGQDDTSQELPRAGRILVAGGQPRVWGARIAPATCRRELEAAGWCGVAHAGWASWQRGAGEASEPAVAWWGPANGSGRLQVAGGTKWGWCSAVVDDYDFWLTLVWRTGGIGQWAVPKAPWPMRAYAVRMVSDLTVIRSDNQKRSWQRLVEFLWRARHATRATASGG